MSKAKENNNMISGCNCLNCRLGRIEEQLDYIQQVLETNNSGNPGSKGTRKGK